VSLSPLERLAELPPDVREQWLAEQEPWVQEEIARGEWWWTARPEQRAPDGNWFIWMMMTGRGFGKTRGGSEWIVDQAEEFPYTRSGASTQWLVIGQTLADTRTFCIEGESGILAVLHRRGYVRNVDYFYAKAPKPMITLARHGQVFYFEGCDDEDTGRGYNASGAWLDELGKWRYTHTVWREGIMPSLRADLPNGGRPRCVVTTTPKPIKLIKEWYGRWRAGDTSVAVTTGSTYENFANLSPDMIAEFRKEYEGTTIGRQEMHGELLEDVDGALWTHALIEKYRVLPAAVPEMKMIVVGVDPAGTGLADEQGLVAVGRGVDGEDYVLADLSKRVAGKPAARRAWELFAALNATWLIYEDTFGKQWLTSVLKDVYIEMQKEGVFPPGGAPPMKDVHALYGKRLRAEPCAVRYEQGRVHHVGGFPELEDQMCTWVPDEDLDSPDRIDALVHAQAFLRSRERGRAAVAVPGGAGVDAAGRMPVAGVHAA